MGEVKGGTRSVRYQTQSIRQFLIIMTELIEVDILERPGQESTLQEWLS